MTRKFLPWLCIFDESCHWLQFRVDYCGDDVAFFSLFRAKLFTGKLGSQEISNFIPPWLESTLLLPHPIRTHKDQCGPLCHSTVLCSVAWVYFLLPRPIRPLPSKVIFRQMSSSVKGRLPPKVVFCQRLSSVKGYLVCVGGRENLVVIRLQACRYCL